MPQLLTILGPTASGKTHLACELALRIHGEIISADSRQVYRKMDLGTGKDIEEYTLNGVQIPYHLIDIVDPGVKYHIGRFQEDFIQAYNAIVSRKNQPILCGGSGLYIETAIEGQSYLGIPKNLEFRETLKDLDEVELNEKVKRIDPDILDILTVQTHDRKIRALEIDLFLKKHPDWKPIEIPQFDNVLVGIDIDREIRRERITKRLKERLKEGMIDEVEDLLESDLTFDDLEYYGLEYKWIGRLLKGVITQNEMFENLNIAIHQFAKRQMTWFRGMERKGYKIHWVDFNWSTEKKIEFVQKLLIP